LVIATAAIRVYLRDGMLVTIFDNALGRWLVVSVDDGNDVVVA
jgi:hypothetical protein